MGLFGIEVLREAREPGDVGEQHGDELPLSLELATP